MKACLFIKMKACFNIGMDPKKIIEDAGGRAEVARLCECSPQAVSQWFGSDPKTGKQRTIPKSRLLFLRAVRPDVFCVKAEAGAQGTDGDVGEASHA